MPTVSNKNLQLNFIITCPEVAEVKDTIEIKPYNSVNILLIEVRLIDISIKSHWVTGLANNYSTWYLTLMIVVPEPKRYIS